MNQIYRLPLFLLFIIFQFPILAQHSLDFDGTNDFVDCSNNGVLMPTAEITVEAWFRANDLGSAVHERSIVGKDVCCPDRGYMLRHGAGDVSFVVAVGNSWREARSSTGNLVTIGTWHHIAGTFDGNQVRIFLDGVEVGSTPVTGGIDANPAAVHIGNSSGFGGRLFNGQIDDVKIWNIARSPSEIATTRCCSFTGTETGLVAYWKMDDGTGSGILSDAAGSNDGTLTNMNPSTDWLGDYVPTCVDDACNPVVLPFNCRTQLEYALCKTGTTTIPPPTCAGFLGNDAWFSAEVPPSGDIIIDTRAGTLTDAAMAVYSGSCNALTQIACDDNSGQGNMPLVRLTGRSPGEILLVRLWENGGLTGGSFSMAAGDPNSIYCLQGTATNASGLGSNCVSLTQNLTDQSACAWNYGVFDFSQPFTHQLSVNLGNNDAGADGVAFIYQNDPRGSSACGLSGLGLSAQGILNSWIVEFDTYDNGLSGERVADHVSIGINGVLNPVPTLTGGQLPPQDMPNLEDGANHILMTSWDPTTMLFEVFVDNTRYLSINHDIINNIFGGNPMVYWGFTGSTGGLTNHQSFCPLDIVLSAQLQKFNSSCVDNGVHLKWTAVEEQSNEKFIVEHSTNGYSFDERAELPSMGKHGQPITYEWTDKQSQAGSNYYRIKAIDVNGVSKIVSPITVQDCLVDQNSVYIYQEVNNWLTLNCWVHATTEVTIELHDISGKVIYKGHEQFGLGKNISRIPLEGLVPAVYILSIYSGTWNKNLKFVKE